MTDPARLHLQVGRRFGEGESIDHVAGSFGLAREDIEFALRAHLRWLGRPGGPHRSRSAQKALALLSLDLACDHFQVSLKDALHSRQMPALHARWSAWLALVELGWSQNAVAKAYGVDHTTVMHAVGSAPADLRLVVSLIAVRLSQEAPEGAE